MLTRHRPPSRRTAPSCRRLVCLLLLGGLQRHGVLCRDVSGCRAAHVRFQNSRRCPPPPSRSSEEGGLKRHATWQDLTAQRRGRAAKTPGCQASSPLRPIRLHMDCGGRESLLAVVVWELDGVPYWIVEVRLTSRLASDFFTIRRPGPAAGLCGCEIGMAKIWLP